MADEAPSLEELRARAAKIRATLDDLNEAGAVNAAERARAEQTLQEECLGLRRRIVDPAMMSLAARFAATAKLRHDTTPSGALETSFDCRDAASTSCTVVTEIRLLPASKVIELKVHVSRGGIRILDDHPAVAETEYQAARELEAQLQRCVETLESDAAQS